MIERRIMTPPNLRAFKFCLVCITSQRHKTWCCVVKIRYKMIVTPAQAGVQFKDAWIPACAGMTAG